MKLIHPSIIDKPLATLIAKFPRMLRPTMLVASFIAAPPVITVILLCLICTALAINNYALLLDVFIIFALSPLAELSKLITRRKRPETIYVEQMRFKTYSFPSGHSYIAALVFGFLAITALALQPFGWLLTLLLIFLIMIVGISRVYLGAHFPSDVAAGWILGGTAVYIVSRVG